MSHFAEVSNGVVIQVIVATQDFINSLPNAFSWIQTSYNTKGGIHYGPDRNPDGGVALRGNYAGIGYIYDAKNDVFYQPQPYPSWTLNKDIWLWEAPIPSPTGALYRWDEPTKTWIEVVTD